MRAQLFIKPFLIIVATILLPATVWSHPGIGIVKDSKGNIFYTDLQQIWKIGHGNKTIVVPHVHTHELYIDAQDNLYGEHQFNNAAGDSFYHYLWKLQPNGTLDKVQPTQLAFQQIDFSLARDKAGNAYYIKHFIKHPDEAHIYKKDTSGKETIFARGNFKGVHWLHPQADGSILFVQTNNVYKAMPGGNIITIAKRIGNAKPSFSFSGNSIMVWGAWQDDAANTYVAVFSDQAVKKIAKDGNVSTYYQSKGNWAPIHGVFYNSGKLWVLESSDKNEIRAVQADATPTPGNKLFTTLSVGGSILCSILLYLFFKMQQREQQRAIALKYFDPSKGK